jgi:uncharacterized damage-inducible protein DinB
MTKDEYLKFTEGIFKATRGLMKLTPEEKLDFKPMDGLMTIAQVLKHLTGTLGASFSMAVHHSWPDIPEEEILPPAEKLPKSNSVEEAVKEMDQDWELLKEELGKISDEKFNETKINVPWMPYPMTLLEYMMQAMEHLSNHRMQLFIWLKLSGEPLNTGHLYGMG